MILKFGRDCLGSYYLWGNIKTYYKPGNLKCKKRALINAKNHVLSIINKTKLSSLSSV